MKTNIQEQFCFIIPKKERIKNKASKVQGNSKPSDLTRVANESYGIS